MAAWRLLRVTPDVPGHARRRDVPLVGREPQRRLLLDAFDLVVAKRACRLVTVLGAAGVGKSRLVDEALASIGERATVLRGRCLSYGEGITYWPVAEVVRQAAGIAHDDSLPAAQGKLAALLAGQEQAEQIASRIAGLVGLGDSVAVDGSLQGVDPATALSDVEFRFLIVQGDVVVQGKGRGSVGFWSGTAPAGQGDLEEGNALAIGLAYLSRRNPAGYEIFSWSNQIRLAP